MKRILLSLTAILFTLFIFNYCEDPPPPVPDCEMNYTGNVTVTNETRYVIWVDVTWRNIDENYEYRLQPGNSFKYTKIPAGNIKIWASFDRNDWVFNSEYLKVCENMPFTWYLPSNKSTEKKLILKNEKNNEISIGIIQNKYLK